MHAAWKGHPQVIVALLDAGALIDEKNEVVNSRFLMITHFYYVSL
jgi:hypothetical protein